jgi:hypothetical protein
MFAARVAIALVADDVRATVLSDSAGGRLEAKVWAARAPGRISDAVRTVWKLDIEKQPRVVILPHRSLVVAARLRMRGWVDQKGRHRAECVAACTADETAVHTKGLGERAARM